MVAFSRQLSLMNLKPILDENILRRQGVPPYPRIREVIPTSEKAVPAALVHARLPSSPRYGSGFKSNQWHRGYRVPGIRQFGMLDVEVCHLES